MECSRPSWACKLEDARSMHRDSRAHEAYWRSKLTDRAFMGPICAGATYVSLTLPTPACSGMFPLTRIRTKGLPMSWPRVRNSWGTTCVCFVAAIGSLAAQQPSEKQTSDKYLATAELYRR